jgi:hypothetical protein
MRALSEHYFQLCFETWQRQEKCNKSHSLNVSDNVLFSLWNQRDCC